MRKFSTPFQEIFLTTYLKEIRKDFCLNVDSNKQVAKQIVNICLTNEIT